MNKRFRGSLIGAAAIAVVIMGSTIYASGIDMDSVEIKVNGETVNLKENLDGKLPPTTSKQENSKEVDEAWDKYFGDKTVTEVDGDDIASAQNKKLDEVKAESAGRGAKTDHRTGRAYNSKDPLYLRSNFLEMRQEMESLFGSQPASDGGTGNLYMANWFGDIGNAIDISYRGAMIQNIDFDMSVYTKDLKQIASKSFTDIKGTEWYADKIPSAVYYGLVNGMPDGTFSGNKSVTRGEFGTMLLNYENEDGTFNSQKYPQFANKWYKNSIQTLNGGLITTYKLGSGYLDKGMTRGEIAYLIANKYWKGDYSDALAKVKSGSYSNPFKDIKSVKGNVSNLGFEDKTGDEMAKYYDNHCKDGSVAPEDVMAALLVMNEKGIIKGDDQSRSNWNKPVTRAEAVVIFHNTSQIH